MLNNRVNTRQNPEQNTEDPKVPKMPEQTRNDFMKLIGDEITPDGTLTKKEKDYLVDNVIKDKDFIKYLENKLGTPVLHNDEIIVLKLEKDYIIFTSDGNMQILAKTASGRFSNVSSDTLFIKETEKKLKNLITKYEKFKSECCDGL